MDTFLKRLIIFFFLSSLFATISFTTNAQVVSDSSKVIVRDSSTIVKDSISTVAKRRANRVAIMSALIPGLGQIANKKYWKLPILYGASGVLIYFIQSNNSEYLKFKKALIYRNDDDSTTVDDYPRFTNDDLSVRKDYYRRNRDLSYIFAGILYTLNIIDAYVDSQLMNFDVSDNLSIRSSGGINYLPDGTMVASLQFVLHYK